MAQKIQKVHVSDCEGVEKELVLLRVEGQTAFVCNEQRLREAESNPNADIAVGVPLGDVRFMEKAAN